MPHTDKSTVLAQYIMALIETNKVALGVDTVLYGDQDKITPGITVVVQAGTKNRNLKGVAFPGGRTDNEMIIIITVYNNKLDSEASARLEVDQVAEAVEVLLHQNTTMGAGDDALIYHGFVVRWDPGIKFKTGSMFRGTQMMFVGRSKTNLTVP